MIIILYKMKPTTLLCSIVLTTLISFSFCVFPLGVGFSNDSQQISNQECYQSYSYEIINSKLSFKSGLIKLGTVFDLFKSQNPKFGIDIFGYGIDKAFFKSIRDNEAKENSQSFSFYILSTKQFEISYNGTGEEILTDYGKSIYQNGKGKYFGQVCGENLITFAEMGAALVINFNIAFEKISDSKQMQNIISKKVNPENLIREINSIVSKTGIRGALEITAIQIGAESHRLPEIIKGDSNGRYMLSRCNLTNLSACDKIINDIIEYGRTNFIIQIEKSPIEKLVLIKENFEMQSISDYDLVKPKSLLTKKQKLIRNYLEDLYKECLYYINTLGFFLEYVPKEYTRPSNYEEILISANKIIEESKFKKRQFDDPTFYYYVEIKRCYDNYETCEDVAIQLKGVFCSVYYSQIQALKSLKDFRSKNGTYPYAINFQCENSLSLDEISKKYKNIK